MCLGLVLNKFVLSFHFQSSSMYCIVSQHVKRIILNDAERFYVFSLLYIYIYIYIIIIMWKLVVYWQLMTCVPSL